MDNAHANSPSIEVSANEADWSREKPRRFWDPGRKLLKSIRDYQRLGRRRGPIVQLRRKLCVLRHRFWTVVTGAEIQLNTSIGGGLLIPHPNGIVIHPETEIGVNCLIFQQVTLGTRGRPGAPRVGGHVDIGAGAKVLGPVRLGNHVQVGANAVVLSDVPDNAKVSGIPAQDFGRNNL